MSCKVRVTLEGLPERVHAVANALDDAMPDTFDWHDLAGAGEGFEILLKGTGMLEPAQQATILT